MLIVEGPDGAGKTTLIKQLRREYDFMLVVSSGPMRTRQRFIASLMLFSYFERSYPTKPVAMLPIPIVCDRHPAISEPIYGSLFRQPYIFEDEVTLLPSTSIIYCRPPVETIRVGLNANVQLDGVASKLDELVAAYDRRFQSAVENVFVYDWTRAGDWDKLQGWLNFERGAFA